MNVEKPTREEILFTVKYLHNHCKGLKEHYFESSQTLEKELDREDTDMWKVVQYHCDASAARLYDSIESHLYHSILKDLENEQDTQK